MQPQRTATSTTADAEEQQLTVEEAKQLEAAFKDKDFCKLLSDYVSDISNPKFKEEQEAYLAQLEAQNELPTGKMLIRPSSGFVIKCLHKKTKRGEDAGDGPPAKLFLNIVHSGEIDEPTTASNKSKSKNLEGLNNWSVPYAISPLRMEHDKSGNNLVATFDCCFHPISLRYAHGNKKFLELIIDIAKDAVTRSFKASGDEVEMLPDYTILKGVSYKSGSVPKSLMVSTGNANAIMLMLMIKAGTSRRGVEMIRHPTNLLKSQRQSMQCKYYHPRTIRQCSPKVMEAKIQNQSH